MDTSPDRPGDYGDYESGKQRFLDRLAADSLMRRLEREAAATFARWEEATAMDPLELQAELSVVVDERRVVLDFYSASPRELADEIRAAIQAPDACGVAHAGLVRIRIEPVVDDPPG